MVVAVVDDGRVVIYPPPPTACFVVAMMVWNEMVLLRGGVRFLSGLLPHLVAVSVSTSVMTTTFAAEAGQLISGTKQEVMLFVTVLVTVSMIGAEGHAPGSLPGSAEGDGAAGGRGKIVGGAAPRQLVVPAVKKTVLTETPGLSSRSSWSEIARPASAKAPALDSTSMKSARLHCPGFESVLPLAPKRT